MFSSGLSVSSYVIGSPTATVIGVFVRPRRFGLPFVHTRCEPHRIIGTIGTPASCAMRTPPVLKDLSSNEREIVSSGKMPTSSPRFRAATASR